MPVDPIKSDSKHASSDTVRSETPRSIPAAAGEGSNSSTDARAERYQYVRELSRGGLGVVSIAVDGELNREVALKRIRPDKAHQAVYRDKFLREAQITGNLEHPGVVPVYGMGIDALGNQFYAMRLIRGDTLSQLIEEHWRITRPHTDAFYDPRLMTLLDHFLAVCQTMNYAHRRGVLHRDLKPDNIMVGSYGETLVVDWGLAKVIGRHEDNTLESSITGKLSAPEITASPRATQFGAAMGTPAYASPELISGQVLDVDRRSDIYGLGAILYELLSGTPPITGRTVDELKAKAADGRVNELHRVASYVPPPLAAICMKCLQHEREMRYQSVAALIEDVQHWKADQAVIALPDNWWQRKARWLRHHRGVARSGLAAIASAAVVAMLAGIIVYRQRDAYAMLAAENGKLAKREAQQHRQTQAVRDLMVQTFRAPDPRMGGKSIHVSDLLDRTASSIGSTLAHDDATRASMLLAIGQSYLGMGQPEKAVLQLRQSIQILQANRNLATPGGDSVNQQESIRATISLGTALRGVGSLDASRKHLEQALSDCQSFETAESLRWLARYELAETNLQAGQIELADNQFQEIVDSVNDPDHDSIGLAAREGIARCRLAQSNYQAAAELLRETYQKRCDQYSQDHPDAMKILTSLAEALQRLGKPSEAVEIYEDLLHRQQSRLGKQHPETLITQNNLAFGYRQLLQFEDATRMFKQTHQQLVDRLGIGHPDSLVAANNLAESYDITGRYREALQLLDETIEQMSLRLDADHPDLLTARYNLARAQESVGRVVEAISLLRDVLRRRTSKLGDQHLDTVRTRIALGSALAADRQPDQARELLVQAYQQLSASRTSDPVEILKTQLVLAWVDALDNDPQSAITTMAEIVPQIQDALGLAHPTTLAAINLQASTLIQAQDPDAAIKLLRALHRQCVDRLGAEHPRTLVVAMNLSVAYCDAMQLIEGIPLLEETITQMRKTLGHEHSHTLTATKHLVEAYHRARWFPQAIELLADVLQQTVAAHGEESLQTQDARFELAFALADAGQFARAAELFALRDASLQNMEASGKQRFEGLVWLGITLRATDQLAQSEQTLRRATEISALNDPGLWPDAWAKASLADTLMSRGDAQAARPLYEASREILKGQEAQLPERLSNLPKTIVDAIAAMDEN